jgi:hypothetical protein
MIRRPRPNEIKLLPQIENEADLRDARVGLRRVIDMPPAGLASLEQAHRHGPGAAERDCSLWDTRFSAALP